MWSAILLVFEIVKMVISLIIAGLKLWWGAMCWCFAFLVTAFEELKTLKWENQNDKSKIIKNVSIIVVSIGVAILLIWLLISIFSGNFGSSNKNRVTTRTNNKYVQQQNIKTQETNATKPIESSIIQETTQISTQPQTNAQLQPTTEQIMVESDVSETLQTVSEKSKEAKIVDTKKFTDHYEYNWTSPNDNYEVDHCEISISVPVVGGIDAEEADIINSQIEELAFQLIERLKDEEVLSDKYNAVSSVNLDKHSIKYTEEKITIVLNGSNLYASDYFQESSSFCAFVIEYDRKNKETQMKRQAWSDGHLHIATDDVFSIG
ncbi:MAG: hypothetical protein IKP66_05830 [Lachnospiraceae bacterium]|nr:hypothetical protein [Lachnospiraceae bacterium]